MAQAPVDMILTRYLSSEGWVEECSHANAFDAYIDVGGAAFSEVVRTCSWIQRPAALFRCSQCISVCTSAASLEVFGVIHSEVRRKSRQDGGY